MAGKASPDAAEIERLRRRIEELEQQLQESETRFRTLIDAAFDGLAVSIDGRIVEANETIARMAGYRREDMIGMTPFDMGSREMAEVVIDHIRAGHEHAYEIQVPRPDGTSFPCEVLGRNIVYEGKPARLTGFRDLSERKRVEAEQKRLELSMLNAQKLENLGVLAGGIAHDFNNLLQVMAGNLELARLALPSFADAERSRAHIEQAQAVVTRASELTRQMLAYSGRSTLAKRLVDLSSIVRDMARLLEVSISKKARLRLELAVALPPVAADPSQLRQVVMNLITNASEALDQHGEEIVVRTGIAELDAESMHDMALPPESAGHFIFIEVSDQGSGMDSETLARIFDPFFSTKFQGRGLGLASVLGIARAHGGGIAVKSTLGGGSRFMVYFPASEGIAEEPEARTSQLPPLRLSARVLLADDEPEIRELLEIRFREAGVEVVAASNGEEAVARFRQFADSLDAVVLDVTMPRLDGTDALRQIRAIAPEIPAILLSGYSASGLPPDLQDNTRFVAKPFSTEELIRTLERLLAE